MAEREEGSAGSPGPDPLTPAYPAQASYVSGYKQGIILRPGSVPEWKEGLRLPPGAELLGVSPHALFTRNTLAFKVGHIDLPVTPVGCQLPRVEPRWKGDEFTGWWELSYGDPV